MTKELNLKAFIKRHDKSPDLYFLEADYSTKKFTITKAHPLIFALDWLAKNTEDNNYTLERVKTGYAILENEFCHNLPPYKRHAYPCLDAKSVILQLNHIVDYSFKIEDSVPQAFTTLEEALQFMAQFIDDWKEEDDLVQDYFDNLTINL